MRRPPRAMVVLALAAAAGAAGPVHRAARAQVSPAGAPADSAARAAQPARLFRSDAVVDLTLTADFRQLRRERTGDSPLHRATLAWSDSAGAVTVPLRVRTRGIWRRRNCELPPLRLDFARDSVRGTLFARQDKPKLVSHCRNDDRHEQYVLQEFQLYRVYGLLTDRSHRARLVRMAYVDSATGRTIARRYAFLVEDPDDVEARTGTRRLEQKGAGAHDLDAQELALMSVFQFMIGNTDWSIAGLHNVELFSDVERIYPVAYDFDFSGAVNARYATADPSLGIRSVRQRLFRGYCVAPEEYDRAFRRFVERKDAIMALYRDPIGMLMRADEREATLAYFEEFYRIIGDPARARREIVSACLR